jgi:hypothetical protein
MTARKDKYVNNVGYKGRKAAVEQTRMLRSQGGALDIRDLSGDGAAIRRTRTEEYDWSNDIVYRIIVQLYATVLSLTGRVPNKAGKLEGKTND